MEFIESLEKHYSGIGKKIKRWAIWIFVIEAIAAIIAGIMGFFIFCSWEGDDGGYLWAFLCILAIPLAILIEFVGTWLLYGFGELIDNSQIVAKKLSPESFVADEETNEETDSEADEEIEYYCPSCNSTVKVGDATCTSCGQVFDWS